jgi:thioredoxin-dependent peroxiredoxin
MSQLSKYNVQVFGASTDPVELNKQFSEKNSYNFPLLSDPEKGYAKALGVLSANGAYAQRWTYIIDDKGIIRHIEKTVMPGSHGKQLAAKLEELGIPKKDSDQ